MPMLVAYFLPPTNLLFMFSQFAIATWQLLCNAERTVIWMLEFTFSRIESCALQQPQRDACLHLSSHGHVQKHPFQDGIDA